MCPKSMRAAEIKHATSLPAGNLESSGGDSDSTMLQGEYWVGCTVKEREIRPQREGRSDT